MIPGLIDLDHTIFKVRDLPQARDTWRRLGFTTTPYRPNPFYGGGEAGGRGGNHLVVFTEQSPGTTNMIELAWADPDYAHPAAIQACEGDPGLAALMHASDDIKDIRDSWTKLGLSMTPNISHDGVYKDPETGRVDPVKYCGFMVDDDAWDYSIGAAQVFDFTQFTRPDWRAHPNGARYWKSVTLRVEPDSLARSAKFLSDLYGGETFEISEGVVEVVARHLSVRLATAKGFAELHPASASDGGLAASDVNTGVKIVVSSLQQARAVLEENNVSILTSDNAIHLAPSDASGIAIELVEETAP
ncbi:MAG: VOC family protein [Pseudomonadota bacterium]